jgi:L-lactate dehydrogenase complex protein LldG
VSTREEFLAAFRRGTDPEPPELPPLRAERGEALVDEFVAAAEASGAFVHRGTAPSVSETQSPSRAAYGLADTGSVVLLGDEARSASLLPEVHVTRLAVVDILPGLAELFAELGTDLPTVIAIVTGPSRSADIEQTLTIGVHGPGEVHVVLD